MLKRLWFMFGMAATSTVAADAQALRNRPGASGGGPAAALSGAQLTLQAQITDLQSQVATLKKQVAQLTTHTHTYYVSPPESNARFTIDDVIKTLIRKLTLRHPHVFGYKAEHKRLLKGRSLRTSQDVLDSWDTLKKISARR